MNILRFLIVLGCSIGFVLTGVAAKTLTSVTNGSFLSPAVWDANLLPAAGDTVNIHHFLYLSHSYTLSNQRITVYTGGQICCPDTLSFADGCYTDIKGGRLNVGAINLISSVLYVTDYGNIFSAKYIDIWGAGAEFHVFDGGFTKVFLHDIPCAVADYQPVILPHDNNTLACNLNGIAYKWYHNDVPIADATGIVLNPVAEGVYTVQYLNPDSTLSALSPPYLYSTTPTDKPVDKNLNIRAINPVTTHFKVSFGTTTGQNENAVIRLIEPATGRILLTETVPLSAGAYWQHDASAFLPGVYVLQIQAGNTVTTRRIVKTQ